MILPDRAVRDQGGQAGNGNVWVTVTENLQAYGTYHK